MKIPSSDKSGRQYLRFWRWHFYAAFLVIPFVLWQGITGVIYLWHGDIADQLWPQMRFASVGPQTASLDQQLAVVKQANDGLMPQSVIISADPQRSTQFVFGDSHGMSSPAFVDPYSGQYLGRVDANAWLPGLTRQLHGGWPLGKAGSWLLELGACWAIVMVLTGLYLWWPRSARGMAGVIYPRLRAGSRVFWRDLHAVVGIWFSGIFFAFLVTALPWTAFWGENVLRPLQQASGQIMPAAAGFGPLPASMQTPDSRPLQLQQAVDLARSQGLSADLMIRFRGPEQPLQIRSQSGRSSNEEVLIIDRGGTQILGRAGWSDYPIVPKAIATGVDLHEGTFFGRANQWFNTLVVAALFWLVISGFIGWYKRRPSGGLAAPAKLAMPWPGSLKLGAVGLCLAMPLLGISVVALWLTESAWHRLRVRVAA